MIISKILNDSKQYLDLFSRQRAEELENRIITKEIKTGTAYYINCTVRKKEIRLTPEEIVRQLYIDTLINEYEYSIDRMQLEYPVVFGREKKRADIVIFDKDRPDVPYILVELKKPKLKDGKDQLKSYCNATGAPIAVWSNGGEETFWHRKDPNYFEEITNLPKATQSLKDVISEQFTINDLVELDNNKLIKKSLKTVILDMEDEVLANAGVDVFEEVFKLIFIKLYDEWLSGRDESRFLEFRNVGETEAELEQKINITIR